MPGSNPGRACRSSRLEFSVVFSETRLNTGEDPLEKPHTEDTPPIGPGPTSEQLGLKPTTQPNSLLSLNIPN